MKDLVWYVFYLAIACLLAVFVVFFTTSAFAHQFKVEECTPFAQDIFQIAQERDGGKAREVEKTEDIAIVKAHMGDENFYLRDQEDLELLMSAIDVTYENSLLSPKQLANMAYKACVQGASGIQVKD